MPAGEQMFLNLGGSALQERQTLKFREVIEAEE